MQQGFGGLLKGLQGAMSNPMFTAGASIYQGAPIGQAMAQAQRSGMIQEERDRQNQMREQWAQMVGQQPKGMGALLNMVGPERGAAMLLKQAMPQQAARPWWVRQDGSVDPAMAQYRQMGRPVTNVNVTSKQQSEYDKKLGGHLAKYFMEGQEAAGKARHAIANMRLMEKALEDPNLYTGTGGNAIQGLKKAAQTLFGVPVEGVASGELVQNLSNKIALSFKDDLPGPLSNSDRDFLLQLPPSLTKSPQGNRLVIQTGLLNERYKLERAQAANEYAKQNGGRLDQGFFTYLEGIDQKYAPQFAQLVGQLRAGVQEAPRSPAAGVPAVGAIVDGFRYNGGNPADPQSWEAAQ